MLKVGVIGCGGIANAKELPALKKQGKEIKIVAYCDLVFDRAQKANEEFSEGKGKVFTDYREFLKMDMDAVFICTPNNSHCDITIAALHSGKHVLCEKPMAMNGREADEMLAAQKCSGKLLTVGYQNRFRPDSIYLKQECEAGTFGEIYYAKARAVRRRAVPTWGVFLEADKQGGGPLIDIGTHALDLTLFMMDNYEPAYCVGTTYDKLAKMKSNTGNPWGDWDTEKFTVEDAAFGFVVMKNGATVFVESSWALNVADVGEAQTVLCGTVAGADMLDGLRINGVRNNRQYIMKPELSAGGVAFFGGYASDPAESECKCFLDAVRGNGELYVKPEQAAVVTKILEGIYRSAADGKPYYFD